MDVRLPDGTIIKDVPDGTTQAQLVGKLRASGYDVSKLVGESGAKMTDREIMRKGLEMGPVGNFFAAVPGRTTELVTNLAARGLDAVGATGAADTARRVGAWRPTGFDRESGAAAAGNFTADMLAADKVARVAGAGLQAAGRALPAGGQTVDALGRAVASFGGQSGLPMNTAAQRAADLAVRSAGAGGAGYITGQVTDPENAGTAAAISAAIPVVGKVATAAGNTVGDIVRPFTESGRKAIAGEVLRNAAQDPRAVSAAMSRPANSFANLTLAERTMDPGLASLQRTLANDPKVGPELAAFMQRQNQARTGALMSMVQGQNAPAAIRVARTAATDPLYSGMLQQYGDDALNTMGLRRVASNIAEAPRFRTEAVAREVQNALQDNAALGIQRFGSPDNGWRRVAPMKDVWGARQNIDQRLYGGAGMDAKATAQAAADELGRLRDAMSTQLRKIPGFKDAERVYASYSKKADAADVLMDLVTKGTTGMADVFGNPIASGAKLTQALKTIDAKDWAKLTVDQRRAVQAIAMELQQAATAQTLGKAMGSNTVQNALADNNVRLAIKGAAGVLPGGGLLQSVLGAGTSGAQEKVMGLLGNAVMDPVYAATLARTMPRTLALTPGMQGLLARSGAAAPALIAAD